MKPPNTRRAGCVVLLLLCIAPVRAPAHDDPSGGRLSGSVDAGFDSFQERYSIVDEDTLDSITEFRSRLALGYENGSPFGDYFHLQGITVLGDQNFEYTGQLDLIERFGPRASRLVLFADVTHRGFLDDSSYEFANDHTRYYLRSYAKWDAADWASLRVSDRVEHVDFAERTEFDYDHTRNTVSLQSELNWHLVHFFAAGLDFTTMTIPDTTEIQYESWKPLVEYRAAPGLYKSILLYASAERRRYAHEPAKSSFWAIIANASVEWPLTDVVGVEFRDETERYDYDDDSGVYFDYTETRNAILMKYNKSWNVRLGAGPAFSFFVSNASPEDEYHELGGKLTLEYGLGTAVWLSGSYEPGKRSYRTFNAARDEPTVYSDYTYHRVSLLANVRLLDGVSLNAFADVQPEDHEREGDDATATLVSVSLTYSF